MECGRPVGLPVGENIRRTISISHNIDNSLAFFKIPLLLFEYVTFLLLLLSNLFIISLTLPILKNPNLIKSDNFAEVKKKKDEQIL